MWTYIIIKQQVRVEKEGVRGVQFRGGRPEKPRFRVHGNSPEHDGGEIVIYALHDGGENQIFMTLPSVVASK